MLGLPADYEAAFTALFRYRNKILHCGMEWPEEERNKFRAMLQNDGQAWPKGWFSVALRNDSPWIYYLSDTFITHVLQLIDAILEGAGRYFRAHAPQPHEMVFVSAPFSTTPE